MKKAVLHLFLGLLAFAAAAQSLEISHGGRALQAGDEITIKASSNSEIMSLDNLLLLNNSNKPISMLCSQEVLSAVPGSDNAFSWGSANSSDKDTPGDMVVIYPGERSGAFTGSYFPSGQVGTTSIKYVFYSLSNPDDRVSLIVNYKTSDGQEIPEREDPVYFSKAYPNPANQAAKFDYALVEGYPDAKLVLYNLFGIKVKEIEIIETSGSLKMNTSDLNEGIYFYSLLVNNESLLTQKLVIKH